MEEVNKKKDFLPIILYFTIFFGIQIVGGVIMGLYAFQEEKMLSIINIASYLAIFLTLVIIYQKKLYESLKKITKKDLLSIIIFIVALLGLNYLLTNLLASLDVEMANQEAVINMLEYYKPLMIISIVIFAPVVEEMVFRYSLSTIFKNNIIFVIISSVLFGIMHGIGIVTILYVLMGIILALSYLKTDKNIIASIIIHIINNAFGVISMFILLK